ncbi:MAG: AAA family ATPase [Proteobacteria bacterium]|nr:AAA family ATPase [Pseudomonadota bacterium]
MLRRIEATNFFVFDDFAVDFPPGMAVITGETGSGKSMVLHSMGLALGDSFAHDLIRDPKRETELRMVFDLDGNADAQRWLAENGFNDAKGSGGSGGSGGRGGTLEILRTARYRKSTRACINGQPVGLSQLRELAELLIEVHGQKARHSLFGARAQLSAFDDYACDGALPDRVRALAGQIAATREQIARNESENPQSAELLRYQHEELSGAGLSEGLWQELQTEHRRLSNFEQYRAGVDQISALLDGDDEAALSSRLHRASALAAELREHDANFAEVAGMLERARIEVQEAGSTVATLGSGDGDADDAAAALAQVDTRMTTMFDLARKHKVEPAQLHEHWLQLGQKLELSDSLALRRQELLDAEQEQRLQWRALADELSAVRRQQAGCFAEGVNAYLRQLNMTYADFRVEFEMLSDDDVSPGGRERVHFLISTVAGKAHEPISRISSGGELSRISLAVRLCANLKSRKSGTVMVFDEIDTGIGGESADRLGRLLGRLATRQQILCVTHLATVAAHASTQYQVSQLSGRQSVSIAALTGKGRKQELARMLTGDAVSKPSLQAAQELLDKAARPNANE